MDKLIWYDSDGRINCRRRHEAALARLASCEVKPRSEQGEHRGETAHLLRGERGRSARI